MSNLGDGSDNTSRSISPSGIDAGRPVDERAGKAQVDAAKADGRWAADDLADALAADLQAKAFSETLSGANRYAILYRVHDAKKPQTRAAHTAKFVKMCHDHETIH
jgi:uncharacterized protein YdeI (YjbR/CyaY-like superfamily)